jgi:polysaccharide pyruvyl transferase WcaK-like protein
MTSLLLNINSEEDAKKIEALARELKIDPIYINNEDLEDQILANMIRKARTGEFEDKTDFLNSLGN